MGDKVNLYTGGLEFSQTDVSLPGNNSLAVSVGRRYTMGVQTSAYGEGLFADWDLEIPHLHGIFSAGPGATGMRGWAVYGTTHAAMVARCTNFGPPPDAPTSNMAVALDPDQYWGGNLLYVPGVGDAKMLVRDSANSIKPTDGYTSANPNAYGIVTKSQWQFRCLSSLQSPVTTQNTDGEGFLALAPDGTTYQFDWMATRVYTGMSAGGNISRVEVWIMPTKVTDRFGNSVIYTYDTTDPWKLTDIADSAPNGRHIHLTYGSDHRVSTVTDGTRTWTYSYSTAVYTPGVSGSLVQVTLPDNTAWSLSMTRTSQSLSSMPQQCPNGQWADPILPASPFTSTITHPSGAVGSFTMDWVMHSRAAIFGSSGTDPCTWAGAPPVSYDGSVTPNYPLRSITSKTIAGPGLSPMTWAYNWPAASGTWGCADTPCSATTSMTVVDPDGGVKRYSYAAAYGVTEGQLLRVDEGWDAASNTALRTTLNQYAARGAGPYPQCAGSSGSMSGDDFQETCYLPLKQTDITQQGVTFTSRVTQFDAYAARALATTKSSTLGYSKSETTQYADNTNLWVMGQLASNAVDGITAQQTSFDAATALPLSKSVFGKFKASYTFYGDGTLHTVTDGNNGVTTYSNYMRGLAQNISYADGKTASAVVENRGLITSATNEVGATTGYGYDTIGRLTTVTPPSGDPVTWNSTTLSFTASSNTELGLPPGHWVQTITTGNAVTINYFDALWRKLITTSYDSANQAATQHSVLYQFVDDPTNGKSTFESYPTATVSGVSASLPGITTKYDALGRVSQTVKSSELGNLTSSVAYVSNFQKQTSDFNGNVTTQSFQAFDQPSESSLAGLTGPNGLNLAINRDNFGKATSMTKSGTNAGVTTSVTRSYIYDANQLLCKTIEPELGATLVAWDGNNNTAWRTGGTNLTTSTCDRGSVLPAQQISYSYDARNRLKTTTYGDGSPSISRTYTDDGLPLQTVSDGTQWDYTYLPGQRLLATEKLSVNSESYTLSWGYDPNASVSTVTYPDPSNTVVAFAPNALGQSTRVGNYVQAGTVSYYPNGTIAAYTLGNNVAHSLTSNVRGLPATMTDAGVVSDQYAYDANGNVTAITDVLLGQTNRSMAYDGLDRLITANGPWGSGSYSYDVQDNIRTSVVGARSATHSYDASNHLTSVTGTGVNLSYLYDPNGNISNRAGQAYNFDLGNRMRSAPGSTYSYDAEGRRALIANADGSVQVQMYDHAGQLMYAENILGVVSATVTYSCPGGGSLSGTNCLSSSSYAATATYSCPGGWTLSGTNCSQTTTSTQAASIASYGCPNGTTLSGTNCLGSTSYAATVIYSCAGGWTLSGSTCSQTNTSTQAASIASYSCPANYTLSGSTCSQTTTVAANVASYSCPANYTLSGSTCSQTTTSTQAATANYSCSSGTLSGTSCVITTTTAATPNYSCPGGYTLSGTNCNGSTTAAANYNLNCNGHGTLTSYANSPTGYMCISVNILTRTYPDPYGQCDSLSSSYGLPEVDEPAISGGIKCVMGPNKIYSCPSGSTLSGSNCITPSTVAATIASYSCSSGTVSGSNCVNTTTIAANVSYSCPANYTLSGTTCSQSTTTTQAATPNYTCSAGYTLSGSSCSQTTSQDATPNYSCPANYTLSGSTCSQTTTSTQAATVSYSCPSGGSLSGTTCTITNSTAATPNYSCPANYTLSGTTCSLTTTSNQAATAIYSCPSGGSLSDTTCTTNSSVAATGTSSCPNGGALNGGNCIGAAGDAPASTTKYLYLAGKAIAEDDSAQGVVYTHTDALGSPVVRTNSGGSVLSRTRFEPYGNVSSGFNPTRPNSLGFTGHVNDANTGLTYMQQRYYDPIAGRFLSVDPIVADSDTGGSFGRYHYAGNNPYRNMDPDGRSVKEEFQEGEASPSAEALLRATEADGSPRRWSKEDTENNLQAARAKSAQGGGGQASAIHPDPNKSFIENGKLPDNALVTRGGQCCAENFTNGSGVVTNADGTLSGVSTQSKAGASFEELSQPFKNNQVGSTTAGDIRAAGGTIKPDGTPQNPNHATVNGLTAKQLENLFTPTVKNPVPPALRGQ